MMNLNMTDKRHSRLQGETLNKFRQLVRKSLGHLDRGEEGIFYAIGEDIWEKIFATNFGSDIQFAKAHLLGTHDNQKFKHRQHDWFNTLFSYIDNYHLAVATIEQALAKNQPIWILTDTDNDGSFAQSIAMTLKEGLSEAERSLLHIEYAHSEKVRGLSLDLVQRLLPDSQAECLIITADNGINSVMEQKAINALYPNATLLITDHHNPEEGLCIEENEQTIVFNPHYFADVHASNPELANQRQALNREMHPDYRKHREQKARAFFEEYNISGASTFGLLATALLERRTTADNSLEMAKIKEKIQELSSISNMLDYVYTHPDHKPMQQETINTALSLQSQLNAVNSMGRWITTPLSEQALALLQSKTPFHAENPVDVAMVQEVSRQAQALNVVAQLLLSDYFNDEVDTAPSLRVVDLIKGKIPFEEFQYRSSNPNYVEQLRPIVFNLMAEKNKLVYEEQMYQEMVKVFKELKTAENKLLNELRKIPLMKVYESPTVTINVLEKDAQGVFNRKLLSKAYNIANNGMVLNLDYTDEHTISGSFRSQYDISSILPKRPKRDLGYRLGVGIQIVGHERAAGFLMSNKHKHGQFTASRQDEIVRGILTELDTRIGKLKNNQKMNAFNELPIVADLDSLNVIAKINNQTRAMVSHFYRMTPLIQLNPFATVAVNQSTGEQTSLVRIAQEKPFGWTVLPIKLSNRDGSGANTLLMPNSVLSALNDSGFEPYVKLNYMADGTFIFDSIQHLFDPKNVPFVRFEKNHEGAKLMRSFFKNQQDNKQYVQKLSNADLQELPFFQYHANGKQAFALYQAYVVERLQHSRRKYASTLDVEASGFGNAPIFNIGILTHSIDPNSGKRLSLFEKNQRLIGFVFKDEQYLAPDVAWLENAKQNKQLLPLSDFADLYGYADRSALSDVLVSVNGQEWVLSDKDTEGKPYPYGKHALSQLERVYSSVVENGKFVFNQEIVAENMAFLIKPDNHVIPATLEKLTNIDNGMAWAYGMNVEEVDTLIADYFADKQDEGILFEAHNTGYDARIVRANLKETARLFGNGLNLISDSAVLAKEKQLMYFDNDVVKFVGIEGLEGIYFYASPYSSWGIRQMLEDTSDFAEIQDVRGRYTLSKEKNGDDYDYFLHDGYSNQLIKLSTTIETDRLSEEQKHKLRADMGVKNLPETLSVRLEDLVQNTPVEAFNRIRVKKTVKQSQGRGKKPIFYQQELWENQDEYAFAKAVRTHIPLNEIGYNANGIGQTLAVNNMIEWLIKDKDFCVQKPTIDSENYPLISQNPDFCLGFYRLMNEYRFEWSVENNVNQHIKPAFASYSYDPTDPESTHKHLALMGEMNRFVDEFLSKNREIVQVYADRWIYKVVLQSFEPKLFTDLNKENYEAIAYQTAFPVETVQKVLGEAYRYQQAFKHLGCERVLPEEQHNNAMVKGNHAGDTIFETVAVAMTALAKGYSPKQLADISLAHAHEFSMTLLGQIRRSENTALDTMSFKQHAMYIGRDEQQRTLLMEKLIEKKKVLDFALPRQPIPDGYKIIDFKLKSKVLDNGKELYAVLRPNVALTHEQIDKDSEAFGELMMVQQLVFTKKEQDSIETLLDGNFSQLMALKRDLQQRYVYVEMNESKKYLDQYQKTVIECMLNPWFADNALDYAPMRNHSVLNAFLDERAINAYAFIGEQDLLAVQNIIQQQLYRTARETLLQDPALADGANDVVLLGKQLLLNEKVYSFNYHTEQGKAISEAVANIQELANLNTQEYAERFGETLFTAIGAKEHLKPMLEEVDNAFLCHQLQALFINSLALGDKRRHPCQLEVIINLLNKKGEEAFKEHYCLGGGLFTRDFLSLEHSTIKRMNPSKYLTDHFSPIQLGAKAIEQFYLRKTRDLNVPSDKKLELEEKPVDLSFSPSF